MLQVSDVYHPGLSTDPGHQVAKTQMKDFGGMICFGVKGGLQAATVLLEVW